VMAPKDIVEATMMTYIRLSWRLRLAVVVATVKYTGVVAVAAVTDDA
jgi:hypothetical protein